MARPPKIIRIPNEFDPRFYQQGYFDFYDHGGRNGMWVWHRRGGKDLTALHQTTKMAMKRVGMYWHCLPTYAQARKAVWNNFVTSTGKRLMRSILPREIVRHPDDFRPQAEMLVELRNGSMIQLVGSDSIDNIVGASPVHVTFSEYALCKPNSYDLIRPMLRESGGTVSFITTPRGKNHAWKIAEVAQKEGRASGWMYDHQPLTSTEAWRYWRKEDGSFFGSAEEVLAAEQAAGMQPELVRQEYLCDWDAALVGSIYGDLMEQLTKDGRICDFGHDGKCVFVNFDLGMNDSTAIWIWEVVAGRCNVIYHYENHGKPLSHYYEILDKACSDFSLTIKKIWLPHDAKQTSLAAGTSIIDQFVTKYGTSLVDIVPKLSPLDGIQAGRWLLQRDIWIHSRCDKHLGIEALRQHHYEFDEERRTYSNRPEHDWTSHTGDAWRYLATMAKVSEILAKPKTTVVIPAVYARTMNLGYTLDELWAMNNRDRSDERRVK